MLKKIIFGSLILICAAAALLFVRYKHPAPPLPAESIPFINTILPPRQVIGFLPYWLISSASSDYSSYLTTLDYFSLSINKDGTIQQLTAPGESEPGYLSLKTGKADSFLTPAKNNGLTLSLTIYSGNDDDINAFLQDPRVSADNLTNDVIPVMKSYGFTDLNLDVEQIRDASPSARKKFTDFARYVKDNLTASSAGTLSIDISAIAFVKDKNLADPVPLSSFVDKVILMAYDYHSTESFVTGPVAPAMGAGISSEFDTQSAVVAALKIMPPSKLILGIPLYGYEWETINSTPRSATIPDTSLIISNRRAEDLLASCSSCSAQFDTTDQESHIIFKTETGTYQQIFYPDKNSTHYKVNLAQNSSLGGIALWALGYEGNTILGPLSSYRR